MVAETVSLGVLSLPAAVAGLGLVPYVFRSAMRDRLDC
jgi:hypothetical protein